MLHFCDVYPLPREGIPDRIGENTRVIGVESNYTGQFADLFRLETGIPVTERILKYDGRPLSPEEITRQVRGLL
jgi:2-oxoglutarate ferredoxin oxidoreductase subunit alpha